MRIKVFILCVLTSFISICQVNFEPGFIVDKTGKKIPCLIENKDWFYNPTEIRYKLNEDSQVVVAKPTNVNYVEITGKLSYVGLTANVDMSSTKELDLDTSSEPKYEKKPIFIKTLVSGLAKLYVYREKSIELFYYSKEGSEIEPLVYKRYYEMNGSMKTVKDNNAYKNTLFNILECESINLDNVRSLEYTRKSLMSFFNDYNICKTGKSEVSDKINRKGKINLRAKAGISFNSLKASSIFVDNNLNQLTVTYDNRLSARFGAEVEYIFSFSKNKWAIFFEPTFQSYSATGQISRDISSPENRSLIDYNILELPIGVRYYMYLKSNSSIFINSALFFTEDFSSTLAFDTIRNFNTDSALTLYFGVGYEFNKTFSAEARIYLPRDIVPSNQNSAFKAPFNSIGLILGYQFL